MKPKVGEYVIHIACKVWTYISNCVWTYWRHGKNVNVRKCEEFCRILTGVLNSRYRVGVMLCVVRAWRKLNVVPNTETLIQDYESLQTMRSWKSTKNFFNFEKTLAFYLNIGVIPHGLLMTQHQNMSDVQCDERQEHDDTIPVTGNPVKYFDPWLPGQMCGHNEISNPEFMFRTSHYLHYICPVSKNVI